MELRDFNETFKPPVGFVVDSFDARGMYLYAKYKQPFFFEGTEKVQGLNIVEVYLNDQGREVARVSSQYYYPRLVDIPPAPPLTRWQKFKEKFKCQSK